MNNNNPYIKAGQKVTGTYCGIEYSGKAIEERRHTMNHRQEITVELDSPIVVFGEVRTRIIIDSLNTIKVA